MWSPRATCRRAATIARIACFLALGIGLTHSAGCQRRATADPATEAAAQFRAARLNHTLIPDGFGVETAVAISTRRDLTDEQVFTRHDSADIATRPAGLATVVTLLAGLRSGVITASSRHTCNGYDCWRAHGEIGPADALAFACNNFFEDLAGRLGSSALAAAFSSLGIAPPPIPEDRAARTRLATRSESWSITPRAALRLARALADKPAPWFDLFDEAVLPRVGSPGPLRGSASTDNTSGWFVGYATTPDDRLVVVRVSGCTGSCAVAALRVGRWTLERIRPPSVPVRANDAGAFARRVRR